MTKEIQGPAETVIAELNQLFSARHELASNYEDGEQLLEVVGGDGSRDWRSANLLVHEAREKRAHAPLRPKGIANVATSDDIITAANEAVAPYRLSVSVTEPRATLVLNPTLPDGKTLGFGDWSLNLSAGRLDPLASQWLAHATGSGNPTAVFADLVYRAGNAVVDSAQVPSTIKSLATRLGLTLAQDLGSLLALVGGLSLKGEFEESSIEDPNTGARSLTLAKKGKAHVPVPTAIALAISDHYSASQGWRPTTCMLFRLSYTSADGQIVWRLQPLNTREAHAEMAAELAARLQAALPDTTIWREV